MSARMKELVRRQPGFLGFDTARGADGFGISVAYFESLEAIAAWRANAEHRAAQKLGRERWYNSYRLRVAKVEREISFP
ncbi:MAG: antibiotic biosynthesis monooxygenase [Rhodospirillales bacterium]|nr:antibiotic biosynthesis monooxygenase [Rhodospirillales bacterium]